MRIFVVDYSEFLRQRTIQWSLVFCIRQTNALFSTAWSDGYVRVHCSAGCRKRDRVISACSMKRDTKWHATISAIPVFELNEAAYLLGYEDANSFVRAFRSWEGIPRLCGGRRVVTMESTEGSGTVETVFSAFVVTAGTLTRFDFCSRRAIWPIHLDVKRLLEQKIADNWLATTLLISAHDAAAVLRKIRKRASASKPRAFFPPKSKSPSAARRLVKPLGTHTSLKHEQLTGSLSLSPNPKIAGCRRNHHTKHAPALRWQERSNVQ